MKFPEFPMISGVHPIPGEPLRFWVDSFTDTRTRYLVDLEELGFHGWCSCQNFEKKRFPRLKQDLREGRALALRRCKHIQRAQRFHSELMVRVTVKLQSQRKAA